MSDIFQTIDQLDADIQQHIATRLELRAALPRFVELRDEYFKAINLASSGGRVLEIGCGTGAVCRAIATWPGFSGSVTGTDLSLGLIEQAREMAAKAGLDSIEFIVADGQGSGLPDAAYDTVIGHTVISHVSDPEALLGEMIRLTRPGGQVVVHDADYASLTFDTGLPALDRTLPARYSEVLFANPFVMREMPRRLRTLGVTPRECIGAIVVEAGDAAYFPGIGGYGPAVIEAGLANQQEIENWKASIARAVEEKTFFGSCNYMTYVFDKPD